MIEIRPLDDVARVDAVLPLNRLGSRGRYLVAWDGGEPVGHAFLADPHPGLHIPGSPELQDVWVLPERRGSGVGSALVAAAEHAAAAAGHARLAIGHSLHDERVGRLYRRLGYVDAGADPQRVLGTIELRGKPFDVDDTIVYLVKEL